ncbi:hypothetical protein ANAEL_00548 [Anaerolineales bacterium]|nr:hypothetical protein ANAEL_00548 [Anaerolineales bacterium]
MRVSTRAYNPESGDFERLCRFIIQDNRAKRDYFVWQLGRIVDWKYGLWGEDKYFPNFFRRNAQLWLDYFDELIGFAISENGDNMFHIFIKESYAPVYEVIVQWVIEHWGDRDGALSTQVTEKQSAQMRILEQCGFVSKGIAEVTRTYNLREMETTAPVLAEGFER